MGVIDEILDIPSRDKVDHETKPKEVSTTSTSDDTLQPNEKAGLKSNVLSDIMELQAKVRGEAATTPGAVAVDAPEPSSNDKVSIEKEKGGEFAAPAVRGRAARRNSASGPGAEYVQARAPGLSATFMLTMRRREMTSRRSEAPRSTQTVQSTAGADEVSPSYVDAPVECHPFQEEEYETKDQRRRWYLLAGAVVCIVFMGVAVGVGVSVSSKKNDKNSVQMTKFSHYTQACNSLQGDANPHVITQCHCTGTVSIVANDIAARYYELTQTFITSVDPSFHESMDSCSPSNQALLWLASGEGGSTSQSNQAQRYNMALLFVLWNGPGWATTAGWLSSDDECTWAGLACNAQSEVNSIALPQNNVTGQFPLNAALPTSLEGLDLSQNQMQGSIASVFGKLLKLKSLTLENNQLNGTLPTGLGLLVTLQGLNLGSNQISGTLPTDFGQMIELQDLVVSSNNMHGSIPPSFGRIKKLRNIDLSANSFSGQLPTLIGQWRPETIHLESNFFVGTIPTEVGLLSTLQVLGLDSNQLKGSIPTHLFKLGQTLQHFSAMNNALTGTISTLIGNMIQMRELLLSSNSLTGEIPSQLGNCTKLNNLDLAHNKLQGLVPSELAALSSLLSLNLNGNRLSGSIPMEICSLNVSPISCLKCNCCVCHA